MLFPCLIQISFFSSLISAFLITYLTLVDERLENVCPTSFSEVAGSELKIEGL